MFLDRLNYFVRPIGARLTLWFALVFGLCLLLLLGVSYYLLSTSLQKKDQELIQSRWKDYGEALSIDGIEGLEHRVTVDSKMSGGVPFVVGLRHEGEIVFLHVPKKLKGLDEDELGKVLLRRHAGGHWREIPTQNKRYSIEAHTAPWDHHTILTVGKSNQDRVEELQNYGRILLFAIVPVLIVGVIAGFLFSKRALKPLRGLSNTVRTIYEGDIRARVPVGGTGDELDELGILINRMLERIQALMQGMKDTLDNVAHDLRTPMARFRGLAEIGLTSGSNEAQKEALYECMDSSEEMLRLLNTLMDLSSAESGTLRLNSEKFDLVQATQDAADLYRLEADEKRIGLKVRANRSVWIEADKTRVAQALANLFDNAVKYTEPGGAIDVGVEFESGRAVFCISDTGCGIPPQELSRIWERLYRGDKSRSKKGMGLGLSIVRAIFKAHRGSVDVESTEGIGSRFTATLPALTPA